MEFLKNVWGKDSKKNGWMMGVKVAGIVILVIVALSVVKVMLGGMPIAHMDGVIGMTAPSFSVVSDKGYAMGTASYGGAVGMPELSYRNAVSVMPYPMPPTAPQPVPGSDAEAYEVTDYSAYIEARDIESTCGAVLDLKKKEYVIFDSSNESEHACSYVFKVENAYVPEVLSALKGLDPKELSENSYTIKQQVTDFTSETDILENKLASIESTFKSALSSYDEISALATRTQNAEALAKIIDSKIGIIERLSLERISINEQLDRLARAKADALDRLDYTHFSVNVQENKYIDGQEISDSWKAAIKEFVRTVNLLLQGITVGVLTLILMVVQWALYLAIILIAVKYIWKWVVTTWKK